MATFVNWRNVAWRERLDQLNTQNDVLERQLKAGTFSTIETTALRLNRDAITLFESHYEQAGKPSMDGALSEAYANYLTERDVIEVDL